MAHASDPAYSVPLVLSNIRRLQALRACSVLAMGGAILAAPALLQLAVPVLALLSVTAALASMLCFTLAWHARTDAVAPGGHELLLQLLVDIAAWTAFVYFTGGATNPLIAMLLPLVAIGAAMLPSGQAWLLAAVAVAAYSLLWRYYQPLHIHDDVLAMRWHLAGMWLAFALSAAVIVGFVSRMNAALRVRDAQLSTANAAIARDEQVVALGNLAAGAAHNLGTPLGTMRIVIDELSRTPPGPDALREELALLGTQVEHCRRIIGQLTAVAGNPRAEGGSRVAIGTWLRDTVTRWEAQRPGFDIDVGCDEALATRDAVIDATITGALHTLVNNAADAGDITGDRHIDVVAALQAESLVIEVRDRGPGMSEARRASAGLAPRDGETGKGLGIGLFLARNAVQRLDGTLTLASRDGGGTLARIALPLARITPE